MAQFCINIADDQIGLVIGSMCGIYGYVALVPNPDPSNHPNPDFNPALPEGPDNLKSIPSMIPNPDYDANKPEYIYNPITIPNPKPQPLAGQLVATNIQNASFDVDYKFVNGVAPFTLTATLFYPVDASGNSQSFPINESNLTNNGVFP